ncbi:MAG: hypothetical protein CL943_00185 [Candidatus Diapherotrites archaeon]|uniref:Uncharacterized protein n=1 Tax=Candidatus Iainarchaeum sp. TaxID=3101447 RepID=A0A2D6LZY5_9ARCH|nr:hypothetical protein [Candidatus Diapherotrites archaeon]|tara:strand:+ start:2681 stop:2917 length:237 start_codon:yes stop_codon:yes gene_type:complete
MDPKEKDRAGRLTMEEVRICKNFLKSNKGVSMEQIEASVKELQEHLDLLSYQAAVHESNILVIGNTPDKKIRLAIVDL